MAVYKISTTGQSLIELIIAIGIASILLPAMITGIILSREGRAQQKQRLQAITVAKETEEAVRSVRDRGWSYIATNGTYYPQIVGSQWNLTSGTSTSNGITKSLTVADVYRNSSGAIVSSGGTLDPSTKKVTINISWTQPYSSQISSVLYLTRFKDNVAHLETTQTQFNAGTLSAVAVRATSGSSTPDDGEVTLSVGGRGSWCDPNLSITKINLTGGIATTVQAVEGMAMIGTGQNASGRPLIKVAIDNQYPPGAIESGSSTLGYKTNAVFGDGNYAYLATDNNAKEVVVVNTAGTSPYNTEVGFFNAPPNGNGDSIFITSNYGYVTVGSKLYNFRKIGSSASIDADGVTLDGPGSKVVVIGNYAYIAVASSAYQLDIVDISNPTDLVKVGRISLPASLGRAVAVKADGTRAYLVTAQSASQKEFFIINTQDKSAPTLVTNGSLDTSGMDPKGVSLVPGNFVIVVGWNGEQYQVLNVSNENNPFKRCGLSKTFNINDISSVVEQDGDVYSYVVTDDSTGEFKIIEGDSGGKFAFSGTFESATFNPGYQTANNRFMATYDKPTSTSISFQVSMASLVGGVCPSTGYTFLGPDSTSGTFFTPASGESVAFPVGSIGNYSNPGQCFRYKAFFTTSDSNSTAVLNDFTINYSP